MPQPKYANDEERGAALLKSKRERALRRYYKNYEAEKERLNKFYHDHREEILAKRREKKSQVG